MKLVCVIIQTILYPPVLVLIKTLYLTSIKTEPHPVFGINSNTQMFGSITKSSNFRYSMAIVVSPLPAIVRINGTPPLSGLPYSWQNPEFTVFFYRYTIDNVKGQPGNCILS